MTKDDTERLQQMQFFFPSMKAATFNVCTRQEQFPNHDNVTATVIEKLWVALDDDVYQ